MTVSIKHNFQSAREDGADASLIQPSNWNDEHTIVGLATVAETGAYADLSGKPSIPASTTDLGEGTNLYFTNARARNAISAGGSLSYDSSTGVMSYTAPQVGTFLAITRGFVTL